MTVRKMLSVAAAATCIGVVLPPPALAGPPFRTDDPEPVELHHWEIYAFSTATDTNEDFGGALLGTEVNYGAAPNLQLHMIVPLAVDDPRGRPANYGLGDIELGAKYRFVEEDDHGLRPQIGIFPAVEIPTGDSHAGLGSGHLQLFLPVWIQKSFGPWTTYGGAGYWISPGRGNKDHWFFGWLLQRQVSNRLTLGGELFHETASQAGGADTSGFNIGGVYDFSEHHHLLLSGGRNLNHAAGTNRFSYYLGYQYTF